MQEDVLASTFTESNGGIQFLTPKWEAWDTCLSKVAATYFLPAIVLHYFSNYERSE